MEQKFELSVCEINANKRIIEIDYLKSFAMLLVVWGHFLECFSSSFSHILYQTIYMFHIPLFVFISGYLSKFKIRDLIKFAIVYLNFHFLYGILGCLLNNSFSINFDVFTPYWLLWYLVSLMIWKLTLPLLDKIPQKHYAFAMVLLFLLGIYVGANRYINRFFSMSRSIAFYPFFALGYLNKKSNVFGFNLKLKGWVKVVLTITILLNFGVLVWCNKFSDYALYMADPYTGVGHSALTRLVIYIFAFAMVVLLTSYSFTKENKLVKFISKNTLVIYLLHGFVVNVFKKLAILSGDNMSIVVSLLLSVASLIVFGLIGEGIEKLKTIFVRE